MAINLSADPRYASLTTDEGREDLEIYLQWISDNGLADTQRSFVDFAVGRAGLEDGRHLFSIWQKLMENTKVELKTSLQIMQFFIMPNDEPFDLEDVAGWFDFLPQVYQIMNEVPAMTVSRPSYKMVGVPVFFSK